MDQKTGSYVGSRHMWSQTFRWFGNEPGGCFPERADHFAFGYIANILDLGIAETEAFANSLVLRGSLACKFLWNILFSVGTVSRRASSELTIVYFGEHKVWFPT